MRAVNRRSFVALLGAFFLIMAAFDVSAAGQRVALLIGNQNYDNVVSLANPHSDVELMADALKKAGFESVEVATDLDLKAMQKTLRNFEDEADGAEVAVVYYSGHGMEMNGVNYMIPVDARLRSDRDIEDETVVLSRLERALSGATRLKLVILDACRDNPFAATMTRSVATRSLGKGLAEVEPQGADMLVAFASRAGTVALDGASGNSPFAIALARFLIEPGLDIRIALGKVRDYVIELTNRQQEPFVYGSLGGSQVVLNIKEVNISVGDGGGKSSAAADWENIRDLADKALITAFLERHGSDSVYKLLAEKKLELLSEEGQAGSRNSDDIAWEAIRGSTDAAALARFLERYPNSSHRRQAENQIIALVPREKASEEELSSARRDCYLMAAEPGAIPGYPGVSFARVDADRALTACAQAVNEAPDNGMLVDFLARAQEAGKNFDEARKNYEKAAALGNTYALTNLGWAYINGTGVEVNSKRGVELFEEAAKSGNPYAQNSLGWLYSRGSPGIEKDMALALNWYQQSAQQGFGGAMAALGFFYREGQGVSQNYVTSLNWYKKAAEAGEIKAMAATGYAYENGFGTARDNEAARYWYDKGAKAGDAYAMAALGYLFDAGKGGKQDYVEARYWYEKAAAAGNGYAMSSLARIYDKGFGIKADPGAAAGWALGAIENGSAEQLAELQKSPDNYSLQFRTEIQKQLQSRGLYDGPLDGDLGPATMGALKKLAG